MERKVEQDENAEEQSDSKVSNNKSRLIKKSPKQKQRNPEVPVLTKQESTFSQLRVMPQFGVFESEMQKQARLEKFWLSEIDNYYKHEISQTEKDMLAAVIDEEVPTLREVLDNYKQVLPSHKVPFEELYRYVELVKQCRGAPRLNLIQTEHKKFLAVFHNKNDIDHLVEVSPEQAVLICHRQKFLKNLKERQQAYNRLHNQNEHLSEISSEVAFLLYLMRMNKQRINAILHQINLRAEKEPKVDLNATQRVRDRYVDCLIRKNIRLALSNEAIDFLNYYANLDAIQQYGLPSDEKPIADKKEFEEYMKRKKGKKARKNPKAVLKTACGGCLSAHYEQYNPFSHCQECHVRFHKYCYTPIKDDLCEACYHKKQMNKGRPVQCQFCPNRGLLTVPCKPGREGVSVHVFCMLINGLWKFQNGQLDFQPNNFVNPNDHEDLCSICNSAVYTYQCERCTNKAHPLCAFLQGWNLKMEERGVTIQCCKGVDQQKNSYRRKFVLNYKKMLFKSEKDR